MFADDTVEYRRICALNCTNGTHFFRLPNNKNLRDIWLEKLPILTYNSSTRICNNHFSQDMLASSSRRLLKSAVPDMNLNPGNAIMEPAARSTSERLTRLVDHLMESDSCSSNDSFVSDSSHSILEWEDSDEDIFSQPIPRPRGADLNNLFEYPLELPSGFVYNIRELPQFIFVLTAFRVNNMTIMPSCDFDNLSMEKVQSLTRPPDVTMSQKPHNLNKRHVIKYVIKMPKESTICRDREVLANAETTENATQCDLIEKDGNDNETETEHNWVDFFSEAHANKREDSMYECHICGEIADNHDSSQKHALTHKQGTLLCPLCGRLFLTNDRLRMHENKIHLGNPPIIRKALRCPKFHCPKAFHSQQKLFDHIEQHTRRRNFQAQCNKCRRLCASALKLHNHKMQGNCRR